MRRNHPHLRADYKYSFGCRMASMRQWHWQFQEVVQINRQESWLVCRPERCDRRYAIGRGYDELICTATSIKRSHTQNGNEIDKAVGAA